MSENHRNIRLGIFVIAGLTLLITALYLIGSKQNLFGNSFRLQARFYNVGGLMQGNNVRFAGIDVGTVESVRIENDTVVIVSLLLDKDVQKFIRKNAVATVGTDGLMGNKLVNINSTGESASQVQNGDEIRSRRPVEMDEMVRTLDVTNENIKVITNNLKDITNKFRSKNNLWNLLLDTVVAENVKSAVVNLRLMSNNGIAITGDLKDLTSYIKSVKGTIGALIMDTTLSHNMKQTIVKLESFSDSAAVISGDLALISRNLKNGKGTIGILLRDTMLIHNLNRSVLNIDTAANSFDENMDAVHYSWPFKKYYKSKKK
jgi:phospholipid/cholesterol/gamma-HCH transport system substrate-binding protein